MCTKRVNSHCSNVCSARRAIYAYDAISVCALQLTTTHVPLAQVLIQHCFNFGTQHLWAKNMVWHEKDRKFEKVRNQHPPRSLFSFSFSISLSFSLSLTHTLSLSLSLSLSLTHSIAHSRYPSRSLFSVFFFLFTISFVRIKHTEWPACQPRTETAAHEKSVG